MTCCGGGAGLRARQRRGHPLLVKALVEQGFKNSVVDHGKELDIDVEAAQRNSGDVGFVPQVKRWVVEQANGILMFSCRLVRDYEHLTSSAESREREITAEQETVRAQITELSARLAELEQEAANVTTPRQTLPALPDPEPAAPAMSDASAYEQILAVLTRADGPLRVRGICEETGVELTNSNINDMRHKIKRLVARGAVAEHERGQSTLPTR